MIYNRQKKHLSQNRLNKKQSNFIKFFWIRCKATQFIQSDIHIEIKFTRFSLDLYLHMKLDPFEIHCPLAPAISLRKEILGFIFNAKIMKLYFDNFCSAIKMDSFFNFCNKVQVYKTSLLWGATYFTDQTPSSWLSTYSTMKVLLPVKSFLNCGNGSLKH